MTHDEYVKKMHKIESLFAKIANSAYVGEGVARRTLLCPLDDIERDMLRKMRIRSLEEILIAMHDLDALVKETNEYAKKNDAPTE